MAFRLEDNDMSVDITFKLTIDDGGNLCLLGAMPGGSWHFIAGIKRSTGMLNQGNDLPKEFRRALSLDNTHHIIIQS